MKGWIILLTSLLTVQMWAVPKRVLIIFSKENYEKQVLERSIRQHFSSDKVSFFSENLDVGRFDQPKFLHRLSAFFDYKYQKISPDLIITSGHASFDFLHLYPVKAFRLVPVLFYRYHNFKRPSIGEYPEFYSGISEVVDINKNIELILRLLPQTRWINIIFDKQNESLVQLQNETSIYQHRARFRFWGNNSLKELKTKLASLKNNESVLYLGFSNVNLDAPILTQLVDLTQTPFFGVKERDFGKGILGGYLVSRSQEINLVGEKAAEVLSGQRVESIPIMSNESSVYRFDARLLRKYRIPKARLPKGSHVFYRKVFFSPKVIWIVSFFVLVNLFFMVLLYMMNRFRIKALETGKSGEERFEKFAEASFEGLIIHEQGKIVDVNPAFEKLSGYSLDDLKGKDAVGLFEPDLKDLLLSRIRNQSSDKIVLRLVNSMGDLIWVELRGRSMTVKNKPFRIVVVRDIRDQKKADELSHAWLQREQTLVRIFGLFLGNKNLDDAIHLALIELGSFLEAGGLFIYLKVEESGEMQWKYEWKGDSELQSPAFNLSEDTLPWIFENLTAKQGVCFSDLAQLPTRAMDEKRFWIERDVFSAVCEPIFIENQLLGFLEIEIRATVKAWSDDELSLIRRFTETLANVFSRE